MSNRTDPYAANGRTLIVRLANGEQERAGTISGDPAATVRILNRAAREQDRRHYTASARLYAQAQVRWDE